MLRDFVNVSVELVVGEPEKVLDRVLDGEVVDVRDALSDLDGVGTGDAVSEAVADAEAVLEAEREREVDGESLVDREAELESEADSVSVGDFDVDCVAEREGVALSLAL